MVFGSSSALDGLSMPGMTGGSSVRWVAGLHMGGRFTNTCSIVVSVCVSEFA